MKLSVSKEDILVYLIKYLWLIILLPKVLQFFVYFVCLLVVSSKEKIQFNIPSFLLLLATGIYIAAIVNRCFISNPSLTRVAASINTSLIWIISICFYCVFLNCDFPTDKYLIINKFIKINILILFILWIFSLFSPVDFFSIGSLTWQLRRPDYLASGVTKRFGALTETVLGPSHMLSLFFPFLLFGRNKKEDFLNLILACCGLICVYATHSRIGTLCCFAMVLLLVLFLSYKYLGSKFTNSFLFSILAVCFAIFIFYFQDIYGDFKDFFMLRAGSNDARFTIYQMSLERMWKESPAIGIGVKDMITMNDGYSYPFGSHCTYIGFLYKSGIIGTVFYLLGFVALFKNVNRRKDDKFLIFFISLMISAYFVFLFFADLDASDWVIVTAFILWAVLSKRGEPHEEARTGD